jgi:ubiquinol-cytochrome c reductase cytochrome b subunit
VQRHAIGGQAGQQVGFYAIVYLAPALGGYFIDELGSVPAQPFHTPDNIRPMWYFAPFYAMLRAIPAWGGSEIWGGLVVCAAWLALALLPWLDRSPLRSIRQRGWGYRLMLAILVVSFVGLGILGLLPPGDTPLLLARILIVGYFSFFAALPLRGKDRCAQRTDP